MKTQSNNKTSIGLSLFAIMLLLTCALPTRAQNGTWTNDAAGNWSATANWLNGLVATGAGNTADFSTINITAARTATLDTPVTIGNLKFADAATPIVAWTLAGGVAAGLGGNVLTLDNGGGTPTINVAKSTDTLNLSTVLAGTAGFQKTGLGFLDILAFDTNNFSGNIYINGGSVQLDFRGMGLTVSVPYTNVLPSTANVVMSGGVMINRIDTGQTDVQNFQNLQLNAGDSTFAGSRRNGGNYAYFFTNVVRNVGATIRINTANGKAGNEAFYITNAANNAYGVLPGGYAVWNQTDWARVYSTAGQIYGAAPYGFNIWGSTNTALVGGAFTVPIADSHTYSLLIWTNTVSTVLTLNGNNVIDSGGILVTANIGTYPATITGGTSLSSGNGTDLIIHQWDNNAAGTLTIATPIVDNGGSIGLTKSGDGTLILTAANTYSGNTYVNNGTLQIGNGGATGSLDNTPAIIIGYGENTAVSAATIGTVAFNRSGTVNLSSSISGSGGLQQVNSGTLVVTANQTYSGPTIISAGTLQIGNGGTSGSISNSISVTNNGSLIFNRSDTVGYAGAINGTGPLTQSGSGNVVLSGVNTYSGNTVVSSGTLSLVGTTNPIAFSAAITVSSGATLDVSGVSYFALNGAAPAFQSLSGSGVVRGNFSVTNGSSVYPATSGVYGNIVFTNGLSLNGGTLYMDVSSSSSDSISVGGNLALNSGLVALNVSGALANGTYPLIRYGGALSGSVTNIALSGFSSATLQTASLSSSTSGEIDLVINSPGAALIWVGNSSANVWDINTTTNWLNGLVLSVFTNGCLATFDDTGLYSSPVAIKTVVSPSLMTVTTANTYILRDNSGTGADYISGSGALIKNGAGTLILEAPNANTGGTVINAGTLQVGGDSLTGDLGSGTITNKGTLVFQQTDNRTVSGAINGSGSLIQQGSATLTLANNNSYTGPTTISSGALQIGQGGALGTLGTGNVTNNAALIFNRSSSYTYSGIISGTGGLTNNAGTLVLAGANTYTGGTIITNGTIKLGNSSALGNSNNVMGIASATATLDLNGHNCTVGSIPGSAGTIINNGSSGTNFITILTSSTFDGLIADGTASLGILVGGGTFQMDGVVNTYSGGTILASGTTLAIAATGGTGGVSAVPGTGGIVASNGATISMPTALGTSVQFGNNITTVDGASVTFTSGELANGIGGNFVGSATATNVMGLGSGLSLGAGSTEQFTNFFGVVLIPSGATLRFSSTGLTLNGGDYTTFDLEGTGVLQTRNAGTVHLGSLIGTGSITEPQANSGFGNFVVGYKNVDCVFGGTITASNSLVKVGTAKLTFYAPSNLVTSVDSQGDTVTNYIVTNTITYLGATTISNGVLALIAPDNFNGDPNASGGKSVSINLAGTSAVLDLSSMGYSTDGTNCITNSTLTLTSPQTLGGIGTIQGSVSVGVGVFLNPGNTMTGVDTNGVNVALTNGTSTGVLNVAGAMEIGGQVYMRLNTTNAVKGDEITANSFTIDGTATLLVTNIGPELTTAATFQLFNHLVNFPTGSVTLPTLTGTNSWVNNLAVDGSIVLVAPSLVNTNPTNITFSVSGSGTMLNLSWPADHTGWTLEVQTNTLATGLSNNWVRINNTASVNSTNFPIVATNGAVFYRLVYP